MRRLLKGHMKDEWMGCDEYFVGFSFVIRIYHAAYLAKISNFRAITE